MIPYTWWNEFRSKIILNIPQYYFHMAAILKMAAISFQQNIVRVVHLEVVQGGPLNTLGTQHVFTTAHVR